MKKLGLLAALAMMMVGCAVHIRGPAEPIAFDDYAHTEYDHVFGASPDYSAAAATVHESAALEGEVMGTTSGAKVDAPAGDEGALRTRHDEPARSGSRIHLGFTATPAGN